VHHKRFNGIKYGREALSVGLKQITRITFLIIGLLGQAPLSAEPAPVTDSSVVELGKKQIQQNKAATAEKALTDWLRANPGAPDAAEAAFTLGQAQQAQKKLNDALQTFTGITSRYRGTEVAAKAHEQLISLYESRSNPLAASGEREELRKSYPKSPTTLRVWIPSANQLFHEKKYTEAATIYSAFEPLLDTDAQSRYVIAQVFSESRGNPSRLLQAANEVLSKNKPELALPIYAELAKQSPSLPEMAEIETRLGWCLYLKGGEENFARAKRYWNGVAARTPPANQWHAEARWHLVQLAAGPEGNWKKAVSLCEEIAKEQAVGTFAQEQALFARAWLLYAQMQWKPAVAAFEELAAAYPEKLKHAPVQEYRRLAQEGLAKQSGKL